MFKTFITKSVSLVKTSSLLFCFGYSFVNFIGEPIYCQGPSMEPTINNRDIIIADRFTPTFTKKFDRGDIIIARSPSDPKNLICKRIVALSGDVVKHGYLNLHRVVVPRGYVWISGDNDSDSTDSRDFGPIPIGLIQGKGIAIIWPPNHISILK